jgi:hypothetical protein
MRIFKQYRARLRNGEIVRQGQTRTERRNGVKSSAMGSVYTSGIVNLK